MNPGLGTEALDANLGSATVYSVPLSTSQISLLNGSWMRYLRTEPLPLCWNHELTPCRAFLFPPLFHGTGEVVCPTGLTQLQALWSQALIGPTFLVVLLLLLLLDA